MANSSAASSSSLPAIPPSTRLPSALGRSRDLSEARRYLMTLSVHYERYLNTVLASLYKWNHLRSEIDEIIGSVKDHLFYPSEERLRSESFWLWRYNPEGGRKLRSYLATCAKNYARDKLRNKHPLRVDPLAIEVHASIPAPIGGNLIDDARHTKLILTEYAKQKVRDEYGTEATEWRAFAMRTMAPERLSAAEVAQALDITEYQIANYLYQIRQRIMEHIWICLYDLEKTDILSDTIVVLDLAILATIAPDEDEPDVQVAPEAGTIDEAFRQKAKKSAAALAADHDMQELFGFLPKCRKEKRLPLR